MNENRPELRQLTWQEGNRFTDGDGQPVILDLSEPFLRIARFAVLDDGGAVLVIPPRRPGVVPSCVLLSRDEILAIARAAGVTEAGT